MINIKLNGKDKIVNDSITIENLLKDMGIKKESVVVVLNENIIKRDILKTTYLKMEDKVEVLRFVAGG